MAVLESNQTVSNNRNGFDKEIHKSARTMMLDNIQNFIYQKPIPSCVRETVSNCVDATNEKLVALKIINGEIDVKDVYKTMEDVEVSKEEDNIYADSEFNRDYYDPKWLSSSNRIDITYTCNTVIGERDMFSISDNGVGIGDKRLEGIFSLGFSTKRLNANELGGFGIGQKSALATGVSSYRMISNHNGKKFTFDIFSHKVENINSKWNENGELNPYIEFTNTMVDTGKVESVMMPNGSFEDRPIMEPFKAYYTPTTEKNGTKIEFEVKSHNKQAFIDAVKSQLMYLQDDIVFVLVDSYERKQEIPFKSTPIYEDDNIILSNYGHFNRPHFVIKGIAYGIIDFNEAELSPKHGNMGFKFKMEDLDVVPSRESVRYTPKTTAAIVVLYDKIKATVEKMISDELKETKFIPWLKAANKITSRANGGNSQDVLTRLSGLADQSDFDLNFNENVKHSSSFKTLYGPLYNLQIVSKDYRGSIRREDSDYTLQVGEDTYFQFGNTSNTTTAYLLVNSNHSKISIIRMNQNYRYLAPLFKAYVSGQYTDDSVFIKDCELSVNENELDDAKRTNIKAYLGKALNMLKLSIEDDAIKSYDDVIVPEDFKVSEDIQEDEIAAKLDEERYKKILKERRANREFYIQTFDLKNVWSGETKLTRKMVKFTDLETRVNNGCTLVYFTKDSNDSLTNFLASIKRIDGKSSLDNDELLVCCVAKSNVKQVEEIGIKLENWFYNIDNGKLKLSPLINKLANKEIAFNVNDLIWSNHIGLINGDLDSKVKKIKKKLSKAVGHSRSLPSIVIDIIKLNKEIIAYGNDYEVETISKKLLELNASGLFPEEVTSIEVLDSELIELTEQIEDFVNVYGKFLDNIQVDAITEELDIVLQAKKDQLKFKFKGLHDDFNS